MVSMLRTVRLWYVAFTTTPNKQQLWIHKDSAEWPSGSLVLFTYRRCWAIGLDKESMVSPVVAAQTWHKRVMIQMHFRPVEVKAELAVSCCFYTMPDVIYCLFWPSLSSCKNAQALYNRSGWGICVMISTKTQWDVFTVVQNMVLSSLPAFPGWCKAKHI